MKNFTKAAILLSAIFLFVNCSDDSSNPTKNDVPEDEIESSSSTKQGDSMSSSSAGICSDSKSSSSSGKQDLSSSSSKADVLPKDIDTTFTDSRDGQTYRVVLIGNALWFGQNLNYKATMSTCYQDYEPNCEHYGRLYTWEVAKSACPSGWHLPSQNEYDAMLKSIIEQTGASENSSEWTEDYLGATFGWSDGIMRNDPFGMALLPGGYRRTDSLYTDIGVGAYMVTSDEYKGNYSKYPYRYIYYSYIGEDNLYHMGIDDFFNSGGSYEEQYSVRCVNDSAVKNSDNYRSGPRTMEKWDLSPKIEAYTGPYKEFVDERDGQVYNTVKIGDQTWMTRNINFETPNSSCYNSSDLYCDFLGRLYEDADIMQACPTGWKVPSSKDWQKLKTYAIDFSEGQAPGYVLKAATNWASGYDGGVDGVGFSLYAAGYKSGSSYYAYGYGTELYAIDENETGSLTYVGFSGHPNDMVIGSELSYDDGNAFSIRCIQEP